MCLITVFQLEDDYIAKVLCPSLGSIDGYRNMEDILPVINQYSSQLQPQVWTPRVLFSLYFTLDLNKKKNVA